MSAAAPTYDMMLLLDPLAEADLRAKILTDTTEAIEAHGEILRHDSWGERPLAYPIDHRKSAEYHLLQFQVSETALIEQLLRTLHITDGVVRVRIVKLKPGTPQAPKAPSTAPLGRRPAEAQEVSAEAA